MSKHRERVIQSDELLRVSGIGKVYEWYKKPYHRMLAYFWERYRNKRKTFRALGDINFSLHRGETIGIVGRNGSGKSTLLQIICGTLAASEGRVGTSHKIAALLELGAGFNPSFTGRENVILNCTIMGMDSEQIDQRIDAIIEFSGIGEFIDRPVRQYSSGMYVRLAFSVIVHVDADILIIDEALAVGDALFSQKCMRFLKSFKQSGAVLFVSHNMSAVTSLCDKAIWLEQGRQMLIGDAKEVSESYLEYLYANPHEGQRRSDPGSVRERPRYTQKKWKRSLGRGGSEWHDMRDDLLLHSSSRNDIEIITDTRESEHFGTGKVDVHEVLFSDASGKRLVALVGGRGVFLEISFSSAIEFDRAIIGFLIKNKMGQVLFGDNNAVVHHDDPVSVEADREYRVVYGFTLPYLPKGEYVVSVSISSGTQSEHEMHCWVHDALVFNVIESHVVHGLIGIPVTHCSVETVEQEAVNDDR